MKPLIAIMIVFSLFAALIGVEVGNVLAHDMAPITTTPTPISYSQGQSTQSNVNYGPTFTPTINPTCVGPGTAQPQDVWFIMCTPAAITVGPTVITYPATPTRTLKPPSSTITPAPTIVTFTPAPTFNPYPGPATLVPYPGPDQNPEAPGPPLIRDIYFPIITK